MEQNIYKRLERMDADDRAIRWCLAREFQPTLTESINYARGRDINLNSDKILKIWKIVRDNKQIIEARYG